MCLQLRLFKIYFDTNQGVYSAVKHFLGIESFQCNAKEKIATSSLFAVHSMTNVSISTRLGFFTLIR